MRKYIIALLCLCSFVSFAQNQEYKWSVGLGVNAIDFFPTGESSFKTGNTGGRFNEIFNINDHWNKAGIPKLSVSRHLWRRFSVEASFLSNTIKHIGDFEVDDLSYRALDATIHYSILKKNTTWHPYIASGAGYTWVDDKGAGTFNFGFGMDYWFSRNWGLNLNGLWKYSPPEYENVLEHFAYSFSILYRFDGRSRDCYK